MKWKLLFLLLPGLLSAQNTLSLGQAVEQAIGTHPELAAAQAGIAAAEGRTRQAGLRPNPLFVFQAENLRFGGQTPFQYSRDADTFAYLHQTFELGAKRAHRVDAARQSYRLAELSRELLRQRIAADVSTAYWDALGRQRVLGVLREDVENFRKIIEYHEIRVREGAMPEADLIRVRLEGQRLELQSNDAALEAERARIELFRRMGLTTFPDATLSENLESTPPEAPAADEARALESRAEVRIARQGVAMERSNVELQKSLGVPDVSGVFGYKRTSGLDTMLAGVQMSLPFFNRNQGEVAASEASVRQAESNLAATEALVRAEVRAAAIDYQTRRRQLDVYLTSLRAQAREASGIAQSSYREGATDLLRLLDAERSRLEIEVLYYQTLAACRRSQSALQAAMGNLP